MDIPIPMNAARVCNAIARIGYEPHSALMDIIDNSVAAGALSVRVIITLVDGKTINQRNNVARYRIVDDGSGMDEDGIKNAFKLGSDDNYGSNSLSKYGMGLKSAGLSLGQRIQVISKRKGRLTGKFYLDRRVIEDRKAYVICREELEETEKAELAVLLPGDHGTIVEITGCGEIYHTSARTTIDKLKHRLGVTYYPFLSAADESKRLTIVLSYPGEEGHKVEPLDILFSGDAEPGFDPTAYSGAKPCLAFNEDWIIAGSGETPVPPIKLQVMTFPKDAMSSPASPLTEEERKRVAAYRVSRENKGFFVYRNGRLIRWGDDLGDIVGKDLLGLRGRMELTSEHDDLLHVDVSKQRLEMDDETHKDLQRLMRLPKKQAEQVFEICENRLRAGVGEGAGFSTTASAVPEEDPAEDIAPPDPEIRKERAKDKEKESEKLVDEVPSAEREGGEGVEFKKVRYADDLPGIGLWRAQKDAVQGTFVVINRRHPFYQTILSSFDDSAPERLALEALIFCNAVGENKAYENLTAINSADIKKVLERVHNVLSFNLSEWANGNQDLFER